MNETKNRMIDNYYALPSIPCKYRENILPDNNSMKANKVKCSGINADNIYSTLFPEYADPLSNYMKIPKRDTNNKFGGKLYEERKKLDLCSLECTENKKCNFFINNKKDNKCYLFKESAMSENNNINNKFSKDYNINNFRKVDKLPDLPINDCNQDKYFIRTANNFFPKVNSLDDGYEKLESNDLSLNECQSVCLSDSKCKSLSFLESKNKCEYYTNDGMEPKDKNTFNTYVMQNSHRSPNDTIYIKK